MSTVEGDNQAAIDFLKSWAPEGPWALSAVDPPRKRGMLSGTFATEREALAFIKTWNGKRNLYFSVNRPKELLNKKAEKTDIGWGVALHVDVDPAPPTPNSDPEEIVVHYAAEHVRILGLLKAYKIPPSVLIFSGGGYQAFWLLAQPVEIENEEGWKRFEAYNRTLERELGGDHCHNVDRIMRLPGTVNIPDPRKVAKGRVASLAKLVSADWDRLYSLDVFVPTSDEEPAKPEKGAKPRGKQRQPKEDWLGRVTKLGPDHEGRYSFKGNRSSAVYAVCCEMVRRGYSDEDIVATITDKANKISDHVHDQSNPPKYARRQAEQARKAVGEPYECNDDGRPYVNPHNIRLAIRKVGAALTFDAFAGQIMIEGPRDVSIRPLQDPDMIRLRLLIEEEEYLKVDKHYFKDILVDAARANEFHPVRDYLDSLRWDGVERINTWLADYGGAVDTPYVRAVGSIFLMAAVRRVRQPGCKFDEMLILESEQGKNKSSALELMAVKEDWFTDSVPLDATDQKVIEGFSGKWIAEAGELKGMKHNQVEHLKAFLSRRTDRARLAYDMVPTQVPRQSVIAGTTNSEGYLRDLTGNRRFWPVEVAGFDLEKLKVDRDQLWAEAAQREAAGESIRLDPDLYEVAGEEQERRMVSEPWVPVIEAALNGYDTGRILVSDMWHVIDIPVGRRTQTDNARLGDSMRKLGWERKQYRIDGKAKWHYAKGDSYEREARIFISRTEMDGVQVSRDGEGGYREEPAGDRHEIPF